ncbi:hypothetical protein PS627_04294 [Pseudomonas fluorescens]|nr:hypothetical protein PS627_04294 [Pseudomonas fluorescens]VVP93595.1 hypothetical protein PS910_03120 [Pseudomonas fluorescens]
MLLVIGLLALLTLMLSGLVGAVRQELRLGQWQREHTRAQWAAEAGLALAIRGLREPVPARRWIADGRLQALEFDGAALRIRVRSERGKLDLNVVTAADFARVALGLGASAGQARQLAAALSAERGDDRPPLRALEEIRSWPGMTSALYARMLPEVTLWSGLASPDPAFASATLRHALGLPRLAAEGSDPGPVLTIQSLAIRPHGFSAQIHGTVLLSIEQGPRPFRVLRYSE